MLPGHRIAVGIQTRPQAMKIHGAVVTGAHIVFACPYQFDGRLCTDRLNDVRRLDQVVRLRIGAAAEGTARIQHVDLDLFGQHAQHVSDRFLIRRLVLLAVPDFTAFTAQVHDAVHRLHGGVSQEGKLDRQLQLDGRRLQRSIRIALAAGAGTGPLGQFAILRHQFIRAQPECPAIVPLDLEGVAALFGAPEILGEHRHAAGDLDHLAHAFDLFRRAGVESTHAGTEAWWVRHQGG